MSSLINYTLEFTIGLSVLYLCYYFFLRKETNYQFVRVFLIGSVLLSAVLPFVELSGIQINGTDFNSPIALQEFSVSASNSEISKSIFPISSILWSIYLLITVVMFTRIIWQFIKIRRIQKIAKKSNYKGTDLYYTTEKGSTFTFLNAIYLSNQNSLDAEEQEQILAHENVHVKQFHTFDLLILEVIKSIFWFNPIVYLYQSAIKITHEFQADYGVVKEQVPSGYINLLVNQTLSNVGLSLGNHFGSPIQNPIGFNKSKTLKRIEMMKKKNRKMNPLKFFIPVLAFALVFAVVSCEHNETAEQTLETVSELDEVDVIPEYNGGMPALYSFLGNEIKYPQPAREKGLEGKVFVKFVVDKDGNVGDVEILKTTVIKGELHEMVIVGTDDNNEELKLANSDNLKLLEDEAVRVISALPKWNPGVKGGQNVSVKLVIPIAFKLDS